MIDNVCVLAGRVELEREPISHAMREKRKTEPCITKATLLYRREAALQAESLSGEQDVDRKPLGKGDPDINRATI